ncbi:MAG: hypothetical protein WA210_20280 [Burkholderiaceae bacterium]
MLINQMPATVAGLLYQHIGRTFFVAPSASYTIGGRTYTASDGNDGLSPDKALLTVAQAQTLVTASAGDAVFLLPGAHTVAASIAASKAGVTYTGPARGRGKIFGGQASITTSADDEIMNVTAADIEICHLTVIPVTTKAGINFSAAATRLHVHDCYFDMATAAVNTGTIGLDATGAAQYLLVEDCYFLSDGAQGPALELTAVIDSVIRGCYITANAGTWAVAVQLGAATENVIFDRCRWSTSGTAISSGIDGTGATIGSGVTVCDCRFTSLVTVPVEDFDAAEAELVESYKGGIGATDGGALIVAIT